MRFVVFEMDCAHTTGHFYPHREPAVYRMLDQLVPQRPFYESPKEEQKEDIRDRQTSCRHWSRMLKGNRYRKGGASPSAFVNTPYQAGLTSPGYLVCVGPRTKGNQSQPQSSIAKGRERKRKK